MGPAHGVASVAVQVLVPYAAHLSPEATRGRAVGNVMSGLMLGIMLARPVSSFIAQIASWHAVFFMSSGAISVDLSRLKPELSHFSDTCQLPAVTAVPSLVTTWSRHFSPALTPFTLTSVLTQPWNGLIDAASCTPVFGSRAWTVFVPGTFDGGAATAPPLSGAV